MAKIDILAPFILSWEGGYCNIPGDSGGHTNKGVTLATWRKYGYDKNDDDVINEKDVMLITEYDAIYEIMKPVYWDKWRADEIQSQSVANLLVDWYWNSGKYGIRIPQFALGVTVDGIVGQKTIAAINNYKYGEKELFVKLWKEREAYIELIAVNQKKKFKAGWLNRLNGIKYGALVCNGGKVIDY